MNLLHTSNRQLQDSKNILFIQSVALNFLCSTQILANSTNFSRAFAWLGFLFGVGRFGTQTCFLILKKFQSTLITPVKMAECCIVMISNVQYSRGYVRVSVEATLQLKLCVFCLSLTEHVFPKKSPADEASCSSWYTENQGKGGHCNSHDKSNKESDIKSHRPLFCT